MWRHAPPLPPSPPLPPPAWPTPLPPAAPAPRPLCWPAAACLTLLLRPAQPPPLPLSSPPPQRRCRPMCRLIAAPPSRPPPPQPHLTPGGAVPSPHSPPALSRSLALPPCRCTGLHCCILSARPFEPAHICLAPAAPSWPALRRSPKRLACACTVNYPPCPCSLPSNRTQLRLFKYAKHTVFQASDPPSRQVVALYRCWRWQGTYRREGEAWRLLGLAGAGRCSFKPLAARTQFFSVGTA